MLSDYYLDLLQNIGDTTLRPGDPIQVIFLASDVNLCDQDSFSTVVDVVGMTDLGRGCEMSITDNFML